MKKQESWVQCDGCNEKKIPVAAGWFTDVRLTHWGKDYTWDFCSTECLTSVVSKLKPHKDPLAKLKNIDLPT